MSVQKLTIDFVSDVACPWCAIGLASLEQALHNVQSTIVADIRFQPFQLNPDMPAQGQDITEHLSQKYGSTPTQQAAAYEAIRQRGADLGFEFKLGGRGRTWNTFDCHRLLEWAGKDHLELQKPLKKALLAAYFTQGVNPADHTVLLSICTTIGLDITRARVILNSDEFTQEVRNRQRFYAANNIHAVPAVIINEQYLISGGQTVEVFENALRQIAANTASA